MVEPVYIKGGNARISCTSAIKHRPELLSCEPRVSLLSDQIIQSQIGGEQDVGRIQSDSDLMRFAMSPARYQMKFKAWICLTCFYLFKSYSRLSLNLPEGGLFGLKTVHNNWLLIPYFQKAELVSECNITKASVEVTSLSLFACGHGELAVSWLRSLCISEPSLSSLHLYLPGTWLPI